MAHSDVTLVDQIREEHHLNEDDKCCMFYDWFCADSSLKRRAKPLMAFAKKIAFSKKFDLTTSYAFFKNNCPMSGGTYDQLSICECETGKVIFCIQNKGGEWQVFSAQNDYKAALVSGSAREVQGWF